IEGSARASKRSGVRELAEVHVRRLGTRVDRTGEQGNVARHARYWIIYARDAGINRTKVGSEGVPADDRLDIVVTVAAHIRTHYRYLACKARKSDARTSEGYPGKS